ncbi:MAG: hypothetical protein ACOCZB_04225 [Spirochaetota bacterium]
MSEFFVSRFQRGLLVVAFVLAVLTPGAPALELWTEGIPRLPDGASRTSTSRIVTHRNGRDTVARSRMYDRLIRVADDRILRDVFDENGQFLWTTEFIRDDDRLVLVRAADEEETLWEIVFEYDEDERIIREAYSSETGETQRIVAYDYSSDRTEIVSYRGDGTVAWRRRETTGDIGDERETTFFYSDGSRVKTIVATMDDRNRVTHEQHRDELGAVYRSVSREYEGDHLVREVVEDDTGARIRQTAWDYGDGGRLRERTVELPRDSVVERLVIDYEFNDRRHWVSQTHTVVAELSDGESVITDRFVLEREIEYQ